MNQKSNQLQLKNSKIGSLLSKGMSEEYITPPSATEISFEQTRIYNYGQGRIKSKAICLKQDSVSFLHGNVAVLHNSYKLDT